MSGSAHFSAILTELARRAILATPSSTFAAGARMPALREQRRGISRFTRNDCQACKGRIARHSTSITICQFSQTNEREPLFARVTLLCSVSRSNETGPLSVNGMNPGRCNSGDASRRRDRYRAGNVFLDCWSNSLRHRSDPLAEGRAHLVTLGSLVGCTACKKLDQAAAVLAIFAERPQICQALREYCGHVPACRFCLVCVARAGPRQT